MVLGPIATPEDGSYNRLRFVDAMKHFSGFRFDEKGNGPQSAAGHARGAVASIAADANILLRLGAAFVDASRSDCSVFLVDGERGRGKSALCAEFMRRAREVPSARVGHGQAVAHARTL